MNAFMVDLNCTYDEHWLMLFVLLTLLLPCGCWELPNAILGNCVDPLFTTHVKQEEVNHSRFPFFTACPLGQVFLKGCFAGRCYWFRSNRKVTALPNLSQAFAKQPGVDHFVGQTTDRLFVLNRKIQSFQVLPKLLLIVCMFAKQSHKLQDILLLLLAGGQTIMFYFE